MAQRNLHRLGNLSLCPSAVLRRKPNSDNWQSSFVGLPKGSVAFPGSLLRIFLRYFLDFTVRDHLFGIVILWSAREESLQV